MASENEDPEPGGGNASVSDVAQQGLGPADHSQIPFEPGQLIHGKYELLRLLGSGGVGYVVAARHIGFDDLVALKFLRPEFATHQEAVSRFTIEARASFRLRSEHVARMLDVDIHDGVPFIAMELLEGQDLRNLLEARRVLEVAPTVDYLLQTCEALAAAHAIGVIHRDIKPENLFLLGNGDGHEHLKVLDFGISKVAVRGDNRKTHQALTRLAVGTPPYMSPEQVRASSALDARSDIWSVGCVLYELLTGTAPFDRVSLMQACAAVLEDEPHAPHELNTQVPEGLSEIVMRCLRKDPNDRFADVATLAEALSA
ncbi:MAG TPA: serine/threonine-protein kinase, partial [Polyangiales bacterium]|nr:serine/threonine-protein kinase [Polyangiales bacterium]